MLTPEERTHQNENIGGPCVPDGFTFVSPYFRLTCPLMDWTRIGGSQVELEQAFVDAREHYASAHPAEPNTEDTGKEETA